MMTLKMLLSRITAFISYLCFTACGALAFHAFERRSWSTITFILLAILEARLTIHLIRVSDRFAHSKEDKWSG